VLSEGGRSLLLNGTDPRLKIVFGNTEPDSAGHIAALDPLHPPIPDLPADLVATAQDLIDLASAAYVRRAMRHFRYGVLSEQLADQLQRFWLAIETVAEGRKPAASFRKRRTFPGERDGHSLRSGGTLVQPITRIEQWQTGPATTAST
jgi:hypothetical protein